MEDIARILPTIEILEIYCGPETYNVRSCRIYSGSFELARLVYTQTNSRRGGTLNANGHLYVWYGMVLYGTVRYGMYVCILYMYVSM